MPEIKYKLEQLTNFLGEKKLKQLGLLICETCNHILAHAEGILSEDALSQKVFLTPQELADINSKLYEAAGIQHSPLEADSGVILSEQEDIIHPVVAPDSDYLSVDVEDNSQDNTDDKSQHNIQSNSQNNTDDKSQHNIQSNPQDDVDDNSQPNIQGISQDDVDDNSQHNIQSNSQDDVDDNSQHHPQNNLQNNFEDTLDQVTTNTSDNVSSTTSVSTTAYSSWDTKNAEKLLADIFADISSIQPSTETDLGMGYIYNVYPSLPPHSLICTECGKLYAMAHPSLQLMPLPVALTPTEYELLKGVYVDILL